MYELREPYIRTKFTDMGATLFTSQRNEACQDFEMRYMNCMEAYGNPLGKEKCSAYKADFFECITKIKQLNRVWAMQEERRRQYKAGERTAEGYYGPTPKPDSF